METQYDQASLPIFSDGRVHAFNVKDEEFSNF